MEKGVSVLFGQKKSQIRWEDARRCRGDAGSTARCAGLLGEQSRLLPFGLRVNAPLPRGRPRCLRLLCCCLVLGSNNKLGQSWEAFYAACLQAHLLYLQRPQNESCYCNLSRTGKTRPA